MWGPQEMMVMRHRISEAPGCEPGIELWTPWGVLRRSEDEVPERQPRKRLPSQWLRPVGEPAVRERGPEPRA